MCKRKHGIQVFVGVLLATLLSSLVIILWECDKSNQAACARVRPGIKAARVIALLGKPTVVDSETLRIWRFKSGEFYAKFDEAKCVDEAFYIEFHPTSVRGIAIECYVEFVLPVVMRWERE